MPTGIFPPSMARSRCASRCTVTARHLTLSACLNGSTWLKSKQHDQSSEEVSSDAGILNGQTVQSHIGVETFIIVAANVQNTAAKVCATFKLRLTYLGLVNFLSCPLGHPMSHPLSSLIPVSCLRYVQLSFLLGKHHLNGQLINDDGILSGELTNPHNANGRINMDF